jgi:TRAP-type C4-dicarboxylate transport system substrate-binding protein
MHRTAYIRRAALATLVAAAMAPAAAQTVLKIGYTPVKDSHYGVGSTVFCDEIAKGTANRYTCQQFPSSALGGEREMIEAVQLGTQDLTTPPPARWATSCPRSRSSTSRSCSATTTTRAR